MASMINKASRDFALLSIGSTSNLIMRKQVDYDKRLYIKPM